MSEFEERIKAIFAAGEEHGKRVQALLKETDDLISIVLRGHLILEELLVSAIAAHCPEAKYLKEARLRFPQLVALLRALEKMPVVPDAYWRALLDFNTLRNSLAHQLESKNLQGRVDAFATQVIKSVNHELPKANSSRQSLETALYFLIGAFEAVAVWQASLEELILHQSSKAT